MATPTQASQTVVKQRLDQIDEATAIATGELISKVWPRIDRGAKERAEQLKALGRDYSGPPEQAPTSMLVLESGGEEESTPRVIGHALAFPRTIGFEVEGESQEMTILALAMVATDPDRRGEGLGVLVVKAVFELVDSGVFPFSLYQTSFPVQPFYERLGASRVTNPIIDSTWAPSSRAASKNDCPFWDDIAMRYPGDKGVGGESWPEGVIDLRGDGY